MFALPLVFRYLTSVAARNRNAHALRIERIDNMTPTAEGLLL